MLTQVADSIAALERASEALATLCRFSFDTLTACPAYAPVAAHSSLPGAEECRFAFVDRSSNHARVLRCRRESQPE